MSGTIGCMPISMGSEKRVLTLDDFLAMEALERSYYDPAYIAPAAEAYAWDVAWKWLNKPYDELNGSATPRFYPDAGYSVVSSNDCPMLCKELNGGADALLYVRVTCLAGTSAPQRHGASADVKLIEVNVEWGPPSGRRCLNPLVSTASGYSIPVSVCKGPLDRGT